MLQVQEDGESDQSQQQASALRLEVDDVLETETSRSRSRSVEVFVVEVFVVWSTHTPDRPVLYHSHSQIDLMFVCFVNLRVGVQ